MLFVHNMTILSVIKRKFDANIQKKHENVLFFRKKLYICSEFLANHNKDYSVVKTLGPFPSSFNGGFFSYYWANIPLVPEILLVYNAN